MYDTNQPTQQLQLAILKFSTLKLEVFLTIYAEENESADAQADLGLCWSQMVKKFSHLLSLFKLIFF